jgi:hypothetical protein
MKKDKMKKTSIVAAADAVGAFAVAGQMAVDLDGKRGDSACACFAHLGREASVDYPGRQMPEQIDDKRSGKPLDKLSQAWADARERDHRRIKRK